MVAGWERTWATGTDGTIEILIKSPRELGVPSTFIVVSHCNCTPKGRMKREIVISREGLLQSHDKTVVKMVI